ncbi:MAG: hypothetical protein FWB91_07290 [Defluviitaleaceae bacterium]|nr:hypothetical protein [Defluviitaleaceae bacterium]
MHDMETNLMRQLVQSMGGGIPEISENADLPDILQMFKPMLPPHEQRMVDLMLKLSEVKALMDEIQNSA